MLLMPWLLAWVVLLLLKDLVVGGVLELAGQLLDLVQAHEVVHVLDVRVVHVPWVLLRLGLVRWREGRDLTGY